MCKLLFQRLPSGAGAKAGVVGQGGAVIRFVKTLFEQNFQSPFLVLVLILGIKDFVKFKQTFQSPFSGRGKRRIPLQQWTCLEKEEG